MKKIICIVLSLSMLFSLVACGVNGDTDASSQGNSTKTETTSQPVKQPQLTPGVISLAQTDEMIMFVGGSRTWSPFDENTEFSVSDEDIVSVKSEENTATFTALKAGQTAAAAKCNGKEMTVTITVRDQYIETASTDGKVLGWLNYFETELAGWSEADQIEYFNSIADYMALSLVSGEFDWNMINMGQAAAMIYPTTYMINNLAAVLMGALEYRYAANWLEIGVKANEPNAVLYTNLAICYYELGDYTGAMEWAGKAVAADPGYGLAHLVMTCVHLQNGDDMLAIETLFKSMRSTYTETTSDLLRNLYRQVRTKAGLTDSTSYEKTVKGMDTYISFELGEMVLTDHHIELLFEAAAAGVISNGQDIPANQISLPYPANPADAVLGDDMWDSAASAADKEVEEMLKATKGYTVGGADMEERQAWCLAFLHTYYEYKIYQLYDVMYRGVTFEETGESGYDKDFEEYTLSNLQWDADDRLQKILVNYWNISEQHHQVMYDAIDNAKSLKDEIRAKMECEYKLVGPADRAHIAYSTRRMELYEENMRPLLEEYWLKMNAMLGYVSNEHVREMYGTKLLAVINREAYVNPLYHAGAYISTGDECLEVANMHRKSLGMEYYKDELNKAKRNDARIMANKTENGQLSDYKPDKESDWRPADINITIPPFSPIYVKFGNNGDKYFFAYGAFGTEIIKERDMYTGMFSETIITRSSVLPAGLGELSGFIGDLKDVADATSIKDFIDGKLNPVGAIPSFDRTKGEGKTYTYDEFGRLKDVTTIREESISGSLGGITGGQTTTYTKGSGIHEGYLGSQWSSETKTDLSFGLVSMSY